MSPAHPSPSVAGRLRPDSLAGWLVGGVVVVALAVAFAVAVWPASEADKARDDGERLGTAVAALYDASTPEQVDQALVDVRAAASDTREHAGDAVADQVSAQEDALERAADGFVGVHTSDDAWDVDLYQAELNTAVDDLVNNADDFAAQGSDVAQAFADGFDEGLTIE
jgi:hypothetical protein